jgi:hypothetical protein
MKKSFVLIAVATLISFFVSGCGDTRAGGQIELSITPATPHVDAGSSETFTATSTNDPSFQGVTWTLNGAGTLTNNTSTMVKFTAPSSAGTSQLTATSTSNSAYRATITITTDADPKITSTTMPTAMVGVAYKSAVTESGGVAPFTYAVTSGSLPAGLSLNSSTGAVTGTPTAAGVSNFTVTITDSNNPPMTFACPLSITVVAQLSIAKTTLPAATVGTPYTFQPSASGGTTPYTWSISAGSLPSGLTINSSTGAITGTPNASGNSAFTVQVADSSSPAQTATLSANVTTSGQSAALSLPAQTPADATVGVAYSATLQANGGKTPYTWAITSGALPAGLTLNPSTGVIAGTATTAGTASFGVRVTDSSSPTQSATAALSMRADAAFSVNVSTLPSAFKSVPYSATLTANGAVGATTWAITGGSLPAGLSLNSTTGVISGTPTTLGSFTFTVSVTDSATPPRTASQQVTLQVGAALVVSGGTLPNAVSGTPYSATATVTGGTTPLTWSISAGALPTGLSLNATTGTISGTPTVPGTYNFTLHVVDSSNPPQSANVPASITVNTGLSLTVSILPDAISGVPYVGTLVATGGTLPYKWSITSGALPVGLTLNATTGVISGTTTATGTANFTATLTDAATPPQTKAFPLSIRVDSALTIGPITLPIGIVGLPFSATVAASGGVGPLTYSISAGALPSGLSLNAATGVISGTPLAVATGAVTIQVKDSSNPPQTATTGSLSLVVNAALSITVPTLPQGITGVVFSTTLSATGGTGPITWSVSQGALPTGLTLNASTGVIAGTPLVAALANFSVTAKDSSTPPQTKTIALSLQINAALTISPITLPIGVVGLPFSATISATGGVAPLTYSVSAGALPSGLSLNAATGVISGTPLAVATGAVTVQVKDSSNPPQTATTASLSLVVNAALSINVPTLTNGIVGQLFNTTLTSTGGVAPITWSVSAGTLPSGLSLNASTGVISGTPLLAVLSNFSVTAKDSSTPAQTKTVALSLQINAALTLPVTTLANAVLGNLYNTTLTATGGVAPISYSVTAGSLPLGLSLNANGALSGTPTALGLANFTITAKDSSNPPQTKSVALSILTNPLLSIVSSTLPDGIVGALYNTTVTTTGGVAPIKWAVTGGTLPNGLALNATTGVISGTPLAVVSAGVILQATDSSNPPQVQTVNLSLPIFAKLAINPATLAPGLLGTLLDTSLTATGGDGPYTWSVSAGTLPTGVTLDPSTGVLSGIPGVLGLFNFTVQVTDSAVPAQTATLAISLNITSPGVNNGLLSGGYAFMFQGSNASGPVAIVGSIQTDGTGAITSGVLDVSQASGVTQNVAITSGNLTINSDNRGTLTIETPTLGTQNFRIAVDATGVLARVIEADVEGAGTIRGNGVFKKQDPSAFGDSNISSNLAFELEGTTLAGARSAVIGSLVTDGGGKITSGLLDANSDGTVKSNVAVANTSTYAVTGATTGRGTIALNAGTLGTVNGVIYVVNASDILFMRTDAVASTVDMLSGEMLGQSGGPYSILPLGTGVLHMQGNSTVASKSSVGAGLVVSTGLSILAGTYDANDGGAINSTLVATGSNSVTNAAAGRATLSFAGSNYTMYHITANEAFVMDATGAEVKTGMLEPQIGFPLTLLNLQSVTYVTGSQGVVDNGVTVASGVSVISPITSLTGTVAATLDTNAPGDVISVGNLLNLNLSLATNGRITAGNTVYYVVSNSRIVAVEVGAGQVDARILVEDK